MHFSFMITWSISRLREDTHVTNIIFSNAKMNAHTVKVDTLKYEFCFCQWNEDCCQ